MNNNQSFNNENQGSRYKTLSTAYTYLSDIPYTPLASKQYDSVYHPSRKNTFEDVPLHELSYHQPSYQRQTRVTAMAYQENVLAVGYSKGQAQLFNPKTMESIAHKILFRGLPILKIDCIRDRLFFISHKKTMTTGLSSLEVLGAYRSPGKIKGILAAEADLIINEAGFITRAEDRIKGEHSSRDSERFNLGYCDSIFKLEAETKGFQNKPELALVQTRNICTIVEFKYNSAVRRIKDILVWCRFELFPEPDTEAELRIYQKSLYFYKKEQINHANYIYYQALVKDQTARLTIPVIEVVNARINDLKIQNDLIIVLTDTFIARIYEPCTYNPLYHLIFDKIPTTIEVINSHVFVGFLGKILTKPLRQITQLCQRCYIEHKYYIVGSPNVILVCFHNMAFPEWTIIQKNTNYSLG